ncbi:hypothetical protein BU25DRAFT_406909 [Macroventuria anomochaeta]|uniref:Uncharacterized protein n=1 Tax=Macroventuria anomochaeta TaxID=301207 RepID=A0ACB6SFW5_9PLEO|nr:uncharacterized protein BU25DRAFT_406909 [Macroventuria anomochaeta]KAF2632367.1 hypothetical protein BU25DRAFT_406909 [Macroventuria anomochaeta]
MSGVEVVAAVSAVVSAFHAGSELLKHIKAKRRKARAAAQQEFEEKQLQDSLISGEQQIGFRYTQDMREMGDVVRVGDTIARDRLMHVVVMLQMEIIKSLQMAAQHETAILNLRLLHEASITNRKDTFVILDEMKQRIIMTRPVPRQTERGHEQRSSVATLPSSWPSSFKPVDTVPDGYIPSAVTLASQTETKESRSGLARYFQMKRSSSASTKSVSTNASPPAEPPNINYSAAFEQLVKARGEDHATITRDIDEIMDSYKGLDVSNRAPNEPWSYNQHPKPFGERRGTLDMLNGDGSPGQDMFGRTWDDMPAANHTLSPSQAYAGHHPTFNQDMFNGHNQHPPYAAANPYPQHQTQIVHRFSNSSTSSAPYSDRSWEHNDSESSRSSYAQSDPRYSTHSPPIDKPGFSPSTSPNAAFQQSIDHYGQPTSLPTSYAPTNDTYTSSIAPLFVPQRSPLRASPQNGGPANEPKLSHEVTSSPNQDSSSLNSQSATRVPNVIAPFASPPDSPVPKEEDRAEISPTRPNLRSPEVRGPPSSHSSSSGHTVTFGVPSIPWHGAVSAPTIDRIRQPSIASTDSSGSGSVGVLPRSVRIIPSSTIQSPKPGQERMMGGRPCKDNSYWGFCKGAWDVREDIKKGLALRTMPSGMYNTKEVWECKSCNFRGNTYSIAHPSKKGKKETIVDPNIHTSKSGIRYRWIFLAKSHVKKKTPDSAGDECNYGCVICSVELKVTSIFGNVDTLMYHLLEHVSDMTQKSMLQTRCIVGRTAGSNEDWDINMPLFADVSEVEG